MRGVVEQDSGRAGAEGSGGDLASVSALALRLLSESSEPLTSRELRNLVGPDWRAAIQHLLSRGHPVEMLMSASGSMSVRLAVPREDRMVSVSLPITEWRAVLRGEASTDALDTIAYEVACRM